MGDSQQDQSRQRAREAMNRVLDIQGDRGGGEWFAHVDTPWIVARVIGDAIEVYFDERMRGEPDASAVFARVKYEQVVAERDALRARVAELEAENERLAEGARSALMVAMTRAEMSTVAEMLAPYKSRVAELETALDQAVNGNAALWRRIFELEAVVRAADAMREDLLERRRRDEDARTPDREGHALDAYDAARAKLEVPHG